MPPLRGVGNKLFAGCLMLPRYSFSITTDWGSAPKRDPTSVTRTYLTSNGKTGVAWGPNRRPSRHRGSKTSPDYSSGAQIGGGDRGLSL